MSALRKFILSADWHLVGTRPRCRLDSDWLDTQRKAIAFLVSTAISHNCPLVCTGDLFDHHKVATEVVNMAIAELKRLRCHELEFYVIPGNHCMEGHRADSIPRGSIGTLLHTFPQIREIPGVQDAQPFGLDAPTGAPVAFTHQLVFRDASKKPSMAKGKTASELLQDFPDARYIFTGDHHEHWSYSENDRHVVNPGCLIIHNADMIGDTAHCVLVDLDPFSLEWIEVPDDPSMLTDGHLRSEEARVSRVSAFLEKIQSAGSRVLDFRANLAAKMLSLDPNTRVHKALVRIGAKAATEEK